MTRLALVNLLVAALMIGSVGCGRTEGPYAPPTTPTATPATPTPVRSGLTGVALFGTVSVQTPGALAPLSDVLVYCDACGEFGHTFLTTDAEGHYRFSGDLARGGGIWFPDPVRLLVQKAGYTLPGGTPINSPSYPEGFFTFATMGSGDTEFNIVLAGR